MAQLVQYRGHLYRRADVFCSGMCAEFAVALHRMTGYPLYGAYEQYQDDEGMGYTLIHAFVVPRLGYIVDSAGIRPIKEMRQDLYATPGVKVVVRSTSEPDLDAESMEGLLPEALADATDKILANPELYGVRK